MAASNTRFTQNSLGQSKTPIDSDHGIYRDLRNVDANYLFERSRRFAGIQPNSGLWRPFAFELQRRDTYTPKRRQPLSVLIAAEQALASRV